MDAVLDNWLGPAIGGAVGAAAWVAGQVTQVGQNVVDAAVGVWEDITQPNPYEEWINEDPILEFKGPVPKPKTNVGPQPVTAEEIITNAAVQETQTGVSSPLGPEDPNEYQAIPPLPQNSDPQAPLTPDFVDVPEKLPATSLGDNVILSYYTAGSYNPDSSDQISVIPIFRGERLRRSTKRGNQMVYSAVSDKQPDGTVDWALKVQSFLGTTVVDTWNAPAGTIPPSNGELGQIIRLEQTGSEFDMFDSSNFFPGTGVKRYSLSQPDVPPQVESFPELIFEPQAPTLQTNANWTTTDWNTPTVGELPGMDGYFPQVNVPTLPSTVVPLPTNNPATVPVIGTNGLPVISTPNQPVTASDVHVINGSPVNSGAIRADIASVAKEVGRIEGKAARILRGLPDNPGNDFNWTALWLAIQALAEIFEQPLPAKTFEIQGVCEEPLEDGRQPSTSVILPPEKYADRLISLGDVVPDLLQAHLGYKTPVCTPEKPLLEGDWITTRWLSDEKMDHSGRRLRKLLRYRSKSTRNLVELSSYWESFVWRAGPVCVIHKGAWWGTPQIWAESAEEGKRVLRHAATEAGLDPDQVGRWSISGSRSPRNGMSGTMRIHVHKGFPWVASRDGAAWPNYLAKEV